MLACTDKSLYRHPGVLRRHAFAAPLLVLLVMGLSASAAFADEIYFKSGYSETAVIIRKTETKVRFKTEMGLSTISMDKVDFVEKATDEENRTLLKKWREAELLREQQREAKLDAMRKFEIDQIAKGLVKFEAKWITPKRRQKILDLRRRAEEHIVEFEREQRERGLVSFQHIWVTPEAERELLRLEEEIELRSEDLQSQNILVDSLRNAMLGGGSLEEVEKLGKRIEEISESILEDTRKINRLFRKADEIEASSVKYETPEEFIGVLDSEEGFE